MSVSSLPTGFRVQHTVPKAAAPRIRERRPASGNIGPYELVEEVARGGMGVVYRARDEHGQTVAIKVMRELAAGLAERFRREAQAVASLHHPHIVPIHACGTHGELLYLVMDYVAGGTLDENLKRFLDDQRLAATVVAKVARTVQYCHERGILHRDLKPGNILLAEQDEPMITDFGVAKLSGPPEVELTRKGELIGTPAYMSPEQAAAQNDAVGPGTDVWGLGVILYELVTGLKPFPAGDQATMLYAIQNTRPLPPRSLRPHLDAGLEQVILGCLAREPGDRYPSATALADDLERWLRGEAIRQGRWAWSRKGRRSWVMAAAGVVVLGILAGTLVWPLPEAAQDTPAPVTEWVLLNQGKVELLGDGRLPAGARWPIHPGQQIGVNPFSFESFAPCLLEVVPSLPAPRYRLTAGARAQNLGLGATGLYFSHQEMVKGNDHFFGTLAFTDSDHVRRLAVEVFRVRQHQGDARGVCHSEVIWQVELSRDSSPGTQWRVLGLDVTAEQVVIHWDGELVGAVSWKSLEPVTRRLAALEPAIAPPDMMSRTGGVGLFVKNSSAAFQSLRLELTD